MDTLLYDESVLLVFEDINAASTIMDLSSCNGSFVFICVCFYAAVQLFSV